MLITLHDSSPSDTIGSRITVSLNNLSYLYQQVFLEFAIFIRGTEARERTKRRHGDYHARDSTLMR